MKATNANPSHVLLTALTALFVLAALSVAAPAHAQAPAPIDGQLVIPWGDIVAAGLAGGGALSAWVLRFVPLQWRANKMLEIAIQWAFNATPGAVKGRTVTLAIGNEIVERVLEYFVALAPQLFKLLGGEPVVRKMALARIPFDEAADVRLLLIPPKGGVVNPL